MLKNKQRDMRRSISSPTSKGNEYNLALRRAVNVELHCWDSEDFDRKITNVEGKLKSWAGWRNEDYNTNSPQFNNWIERRTDNMAEQDRLDWVLRQLPKTHIAQRYMRRSLKRQFDNNRYYGYHGYWWNLNEEERAERVFREACEWGRVAEMMKYIVRNDLQHVLANRAARCQAEAQRKVQSKYYWFKPIERNAGQFLCRSEEEIEEFLSGHWGYDSPAYYTRLRWFLKALDEILTECGVGH